LSPSLCLYILSECIHVVCKNLKFLFIATSTIRVCKSFRAKNVEKNFFHLFGNLYFFLELSIQFICLFVDWIIYFLVFKFWVLYIFWILSSVKWLSRLSLHSGNHFFCCAEPLISNLICQFLSLNSYWNPIQKVIIYAYISKCYPVVVSSLRLSSLIYLEMIFVEGERQGASFSFSHMAIQFSQHNFLNRLSFLQCMFFAPLLRVRWLQPCGFISESSILFHWSTCLFLWYYHVSVTMALLYNLKSDIVITPALLFFT
jgi:hypothetical protein